MSDYPLSRPQRRIWFAEHLRRPSAAYVLDASLRLRGWLDIAALERALARLVAHHPMLRLEISVTDGIPHQRHAEVASNEMVLPVIDMTGVEIADESRILKCLRSLQAEPMNLLTGPLFRAGLIAVSRDDHVLNIGYHHLAGDAVFTRQLRANLMHLYAVEAGLPPNTSLSADISYAEFVAAESTSAGQAAMQRALQATLKRLNGAPLDNSLSTDVVVPDGSQVGATWVPLDISAELSQRVAEVARRARVTPFVVYSLAMHVLIRKYRNQTDTLVGFMTANRSRAQRFASGLYAQTLVQRLNSTGGVSIEVALKQLAVDLLAATDAEQAQFESVASALGLAGTNHQHPIFQSMVNYAELDGALDIEGLQVEPLSYPPDCAWLDTEIRLHVSRKGEVHGYMGFMGDRFSERATNRLALGYVHVVEQLVSDPSRALDSVDVLDGAGKAEVLLAGNGPTRRYDDSLPQRLWTQCASTPDAVALSFEGRQVTYAELQRSAGSVAAKLLELEIGPGDVVAVSAHRSIELVTAMVGVTLCGAAYLALDPELPFARRAFMLKDISPQAVLASSAVLAKWDDVPSNAHDIAELAGADVTLDGPVAVVGSEVAYVLYTSGSTGEPKAVANTHEGIINRLGWMQDAYPISAGDTVLQKTPFTFDVSVWEFYWPLVSGARLLLARPGGHRDPQYMGALMRSESVTIVHFVPSMLRAFVNAGELDAPTSLRHIICSGEALPADLSREVLALTSAGLHNLYGPTEAAIDVSSFDCRSERLGTVVPIGGAVANTSLRVLDASMRLMPFGATGELYLGGVQLAKGYVNRPELTAERFVEDPFDIHERLYRTGDLASMRDDGVVLYVGRADRQLKVRGVRIEPRELEAVLEGVDGVVHAVVAPDKAGHLVAYVRANGDVDRLTLTSAATAELPVHLHPARYHFMGEMPLLTTGKLDYKALARHDESSASGEHGTRDIVPARTDDERTILAAMEAVLPSAALGIDTSFFAAGGDSIRSIELVTRLRRVGYDIDVDDLFRWPTVRQLLAASRSAHQRAADDLRVEPFSLISNEVRRCLPTAVVDAFPIAPALAGLFFESSRPDSYQVYLTSIVVHSSFCEERFRISVGKLLSRHPVLRSSLWTPPGKGAAPLQVVHRSVADPITIVDLRSDGAGHSRVRISEFLNVEPMTAFDWFAPPLLRITVHVIDGSCFRVTLTEPFLDGFSASLSLTELIASYRGDAEDDDIELRAYVDYVARQLASVKDANDSDFWHSQLAGAPSTRIAALDAGPATNFEAIDVVFEPEVAAALEAHNRSTGIPIKSLLFAAHARTLGALTGQREVVTGMMANGRPNTDDGTSSVGLFLNVTPLRVQLTGETWLDLAEAVRVAEGDTLRHRLFPFAEMHRLGLTDGVGTLFNFTHFHPFDRLGDLVGDRVANDQTYFPLTVQFQIEPRRRTLSLRLEFFGAVLSSFERDAIVELYEASVRAMAAAPDSSHSKDSLLGDAEGTDDRCIDGQSREGWTEGLHNVFVRRALASPDEVALRSDSETLTYADVQAAVGQVADTLKRLGIRPGEPVGVCLPRSIDLPIAILGILAAGAVYMPLDPTLPQLRRNLMIETAGCKRVITTSDDATFAEDITTILVERIASSGCGSPLEVDETFDPEQSAYLIFTSGSTGIPKGVLVSHRAVHNRLEWGWHEMPFDSDETISARTPIAFVDSVAELLSGLLGGAPTYFGSDETADPRFLLKEWSRSGVTRVTMTPTLLSELLRLEVDLANEVPRLTTWVVSGEVLSTNHAHELTKRLPAARLYNLYGSTELAGDATAYRVVGNEMGPTIPIGTPIFNCSAMVVDPWDNPMPGGVVGELVVCGDAVGNGYIGNPDATAERFYIIGGGPGIERPAFRTGDLAYVGPDAQVHIMGRRDRQLKIRGVRLEPAEIEAALCDLESVKKAVVVGEGDRCLAFLLLGEGAEVPDVPALRNHVRAHLHSAAVPDQFAVVSELPLTVTGKIDQRRLSSHATWLTTETSAEPPETLVEKELAKLWVDRLGVVMVHRDDDFFALGGNSLHATLLAGCVRALMGVKLVVGDVFDNPTLRAQASLVEQRLLDSIEAAS